jgi:hydrogenase nickel incorporation protein HypA/HybF
MHELSIAMGIVEAAAEEAELRHAKVSAVHLKLGALSGVVKDALLFSYEIACQDTPLAGSKLVIEDIPVAVFCARCQKTHTLASLQSFTCPDCGTPTMDIRQGKELEVFALEIEEHDAEEKNERFHVGSLK